MISFEDIEFQKIQKLFKENLDLKQELTEIHSENERLKEILKGNLNDQYLILTSVIPDDTVRTHDFYQLIVEMANSLIIHWGANGTLNYVNDYTLQFFGYTKEEMIGKSSMLIVPETELSGRDLSHLVNDIVLNPQKYILFENENIRKNGEHVWISWTNRAITDKEGKVTGIIAIGNDITELKRAEEILRNQNIELRLAKEKAEESDHLKSAFLSNLRHEIRTPMNGILGFTDLLKTPGLSTETQHSYLDAINSCGKKMLDVINALIDISQIQAGKIVIESETTDIQNLLDDLRICFKPEADKKRIELRCSMNHIQQGTTIETDKIKLTQILNNLIKNAIRFTSEGFVEFGCRIKNDDCEFYVKDTGIGIKKEYQKQIFESFRQGEISPSGIQEGTGLGLTISKAFVDLLGGTMRLKSEYLKGSVFSFTIPYKKSLFTDHSGIQKHAPPEITNPLVLIAEDDETIYFYLKEVLRLNNIHSCYARDGLEAVEVIKTNPAVSLILMDTKMSRMDGLEATRQIKQLRPEIPIIVQSAFFSEEDNQKAFHAGCDDFIAKPIDKNLLLKKINIFTHLTSNPEAYIESSEKATPRQHQT